MTPRQGVWRGLTRTGQCPPAPVPRANDPRRAPERWFGRFAALVLAYLLFVILFGAWVRISGSGAGCGDHWPTCGGQLVPRAPNVQTLIEYTHRITSGTLGLMALGLPVWAFRLFRRRHPVRSFALATFLLVLLEAGIGAGLVLKQLVASNASGARAVAVALHLTNTLLLTAAAALTVASARAERRPPASTLEGASASRGRIGWLVGLLIGLVLVAASGAVTALGDTLFPVYAVGGVAPPDHFLVQLRVVHPLMACFMVCVSILIGSHFARLPGCRPWALSLSVLAGLQLVFGALNIALHAPGWLQLAHLLGAQLTWMSAVLLTRAALFSRAALVIGAAPSEHDSVREA
jgi:cytochrome c oxidase assembly protein subunit 15